MPKYKPPAPPAAAPLRAADDFGLADPAANAPLQRSAFEQSTERLKREEAASPLDYLGSMWRTDSVIPGAMASIVGSHMVPDPDFNPFTDPGVQEMLPKLTEERKNVLYTATSRAHAAFMQDRLLQQQEDEQRLGDLNTLGNIGRFAFGAVQPENFATGYVGGLGARGVMAYRTARAAKLAKDGSALARLESAATVTADAARSAARPSAVAAGVGLGAAENVAQEALLQKFNYKHDDAGLMEAALMGAAFALPFSIAGTRGASKAAAAANRELEVIQALRTVDEGGTLTPAQGKALADMHKAHRVIADVEAGRLPPEEAEKALAEVHGPHEPAERWLERYGETLRSETEDYIAANFPNREGTATPKKPLNPAQQVQLEARVAREDATFRSEAATPAKRPEAPFAVPDAPHEGTMAGAFKKALKARTKLRKALEIKSQDAADAARLAEKQGQIDAMWAKAGADKEARMKADHERALNARELQRYAGIDDVFAPPKAAQPAPKAPDAPTEAPQALPDVAPEVAPAKPAAHPAEAYVGREVSWLGKDGEEVEGKVTKYNPDIDRLIVDTGRGGFKSVHLQHIDQFDGGAPEGFEHPIRSAVGDVGSSVGAMQTKGTQIDSTASQRTAKATVTIAGKDVPIRFDYYAVLNGSPFKSVRELTYKLIKDAIQNDNFEAQAMTASEWKSFYRRTINGNFHAEAHEAFQGAVKPMKVPFWRKGEFATEFHRFVTESTYDPAILASLPKELRPHVGRASSAMKAVYAKYLKEMQDAGVKGADSISADDLYTNRIWHHGKLREAALKHGDDAIIGLLASAIRDKPAVIARMRERPAHAPRVEVDALMNRRTIKTSDAEVLREKAAGFLNTIKALEFSSALRDIPLAGRDMGTLRSELRSMRVPDSQIDDLVDLMFEVRPQEGDAGRMANLKYRFNLDQSAQVMTPQGTLRLSDLFETDARVLVDVYGRSAGGHIGLAKHGITSQADFARELRLIEEEAGATLSTDGNRAAEDIRLLTDIHKDITGRPMSEAAFSKANRVASAVRGYTRSVMLPQLGIASAFEMNKAVATFGFTAMLRHMGSLRGIITALRQGHVADNGLARDIRLMTGFGNEMHSGYARAQEIEDGFFGQVLSRAEGAANKLSHAADLVSGNASMTSLTRQFSARMAVQQFADVASKHGLDVPEALRTRWVGQGIDYDDLHAVMGAFVDHATLEKGTVTGIDYEAWHAASPRTYGQFQTFLSRQVRDAIQDHDLGETMPFLQGPLGKLFGELKTFFLVGHAKNFLKQMHHMDATALQIWTIGFIGEALAYATQTAVNHPGELDERLTPEKIAGAAYFRMSALGTASLLTETFYNVATGGDSLVSPGMTANTDNRSMWKTPSMIVMGRLGSAASTLGGMALGTDNTTRQEARDVVGSIPLLGRMYGLSAALQYWVEGFPKRDPEHSTR